MKSRSLFSIRSIFSTHILRYGLVGLFALAGHVTTLSRNCHAIGLEKPQAAAEKFIDGLLKRRLFPLAVLACEERLTDNTLNPFDRVNTVVDLSRTYVAWAIQCSPQKKLQYWTQADSVLDYWLEKNQNSVFRLVIARQAANVALMRGRFARQLSAGTLNIEPARKEALQYLRESEALAKNAVNEVRKELIGSKRSQLSKDALIRLQHVLERDLSQSWIEQALCFDSGSPDQIHALQQAEKIISRLATKRDPIDWESRVALLTCLRLLEGKNNLKLFQEQAKVFLEENPSVDVQGKIYLELARQEAQENRYIEAIDILNQPVNYSAKIEAEVDFCELQIMLQAAGNAETKDTANWNQRAETQLELIEKLHDPYWLQRARALFGRLITIDQSQHGYALLARAAEGLYQAGQLTEAAKIYEDAAIKANTKGDYTKAFELYREVAMIFCEQKDFREASRRFHQLVVSYPQATDIAEAHLMAAYTLAQSLQDKSDQELPAYRVLLEEHLKRWPEHETSNQARFWLGRLLAALGEWSAARQRLFQVNPNSPWYPDAIGIAGRCCLQECALLEKNNNSNLSQQAAKLSNQLKAAAIILVDANSPMAPTTIADTVTIEMRYTSSPYAPALRLIQRGLESHEKNDPVIHWRLKALEIEALVGLGRYQEALGVLKEFSGSTELLVQLIFSLNNLENQTGESIDSKALNSIARVEMACFKKLHDISRLPNRKQLTFIKAKTLDRSGKSPEALSMLRKLASEYSEDGEIQMQYADMLIRQSDLENRREALQKYREVARRTRPQTSRWFAAKYGEAKARFLLGNPQNAAKTIQTLQILYPDLGGEQWRLRFKKLLATCMDSKASPR